MTDATAAKNDDNIPQMLAELMTSVIGLPQSLQQQDVANVKSDSATEFVNTVVTQADELGDLFKKVPADHKRRMDALKGAISIKASSKKMSSTNTEDDSKQADNLVEYQAALRDYVLGLLELSNPIDERATEDMAVAEAAIQRLDTASANVEKLANMFQVAAVDPAPTAEPKEETNQNIPPELMAMLTKKMGNLKPKPDPSIESSKKQKEKKWEKSAGRLSCVVGKEIWEALCWRQAIVRFFVVKEICTQAENDDSVKTDENKAKVDAAIQKFSAMILAQGPIGSDSEDFQVWQQMSDSGKTDETERMFYHGIYSSVHLRALKHQCELCYWRWKHFSPDNTATAQLAALINRKFVHIVRHIMPGAGWTADVEFDRVVEIESKTLKATTVFSIGLDDLTPKQLRQKGKPPKSKPAPVPAPAPTQEQPKIEEMHT